MEPNNIQVSCVSGQTCTFTTSMLKKFIWLDLHFQSQFKPPPEFLIGSKIFSCQLDLHFHTPIYVAKATKSISPECFRHMRDHPCIHATRNIVSLSQWLAHCRPSAESAAPMTLSTSVFPWFMEHKCWILCFLCMWYSYPCDFSSFLVPVRATARMDLTKI